jgi:hypothetical protein
MGISRRRQMANFLTPRLFKQIVEATAQESNLFKGQRLSSYEVTGYDLNDSTAYTTIMLYDGKNTEQWRYTFKGKELDTIGAMSPALFHDYLIEKWPTIFTPAEKSVDLERLTTELAALRGALNTAIADVENKILEIAKVVDQK